MQLAIITSHLLEHKPRNLNKIWGPESRNDPVIKRATCHNLEHHYRMGGRQTSKSPGKFSCISLKERMPWLTSVHFHDTYTKFPNGQCSIQVGEGSHLGFPAEAEGGVPPAEVQIGCTRVASPKGYIYPLPEAHWSCKFC